MGLTRRYLLPLVLAPGVAVHELAHYLACRLLGIRVREVVLFRFGDPVGYVDHDVPRAYWRRIVVTIAPLVVNTAVAVAAFWASARVAVPLALVATYLGVVTLRNSIPSSIDARALFPHSRLGYLHPLFVLTLPLIAILLLANRLRAYGFSVAYTGAVSGVLLLSFHTDALSLSGLVGGLI